MAAKQRVKKMWPNSSPANSTSRHKTTRSGLQSHLLFSSCEKPFSFDGRAPAATLENSLGRTCELQVYYFAIHWKTSRPSRSGYSLVLRQVEYKTQWVRGMLGQPKPKGWRFQSRSTRVCRCVPGQDRKPAGNQPQGAVVAYHQPASERGKKSNPLLLGFRDFRAQIWVTQPAKWLPISLFKTAEIKMWAVIETKRGKQEQRAAIWKWEYIQRKNRAAGAAITVTDDRCTRHYVGFGLFIQK